MITIVYENEICIFYLENISQMFWSGTEVKKNIIKPKWTLRTCVLLDFAHAREKNLLWSMFISIFLVYKGHILYIKFDRWIDDVK